MFGKGLYQEEEALLRDIIRSIDKKMDYSARGLQADISLDIGDLTAARTDMVTRHQIRQKIKARYDHLDKSRYGSDILGLKPARLLRAAPKPEITTHQRGFGRGSRR
jgi:hypothetical protein